MTLAAIFLRNIIHAHTHPPRPQRNQERRIMRVTIHNDFIQRRWVFLVTDDQGRALHANGETTSATEITPGDKYPIFMAIDAGGNFMQCLADALANAGFVADQTDTRRELSATKAHLEDMRNMALPAFMALLGNKP